MFFVSPSSFYAAWCPFFAAPPSFFDPRPSFYAPPASFLGHSLCSRLRNARFFAWGICRRKLSGVDTSVCRLVSKVPGGTTELKPVVKPSGTTGHRPHTHQPRQGRRKRVATEVFRRPAGGCSEIGFALQKRVREFSPDAVQAKTSKFGFSQSRCIEIPCSEFYRSRNMLFSPLSLWAQAFAPNFGTPSSGACRLDRENRGFAPLANFRQASGFQEAETFCDHSNPTRMAGDLGLVRHYCNENMHMANETLPNFMRAKIRTTRNERPKAFRLYRCASCHHRVSKPAARQSGFRPPTTRTSPLF